MGRRRVAVVFVVIVGWPVAIAVGIGGRCCYRPVTEWLFVVFFVPGGGAGPGW